MHIQVHNMFGKPKTKKCTVLGPALYTVALKATFDHINFTVWVRVSVQGVKLLGGHFACLCRGFDFYELKKIYYFSKRKWKYFYTFYHFYSEKSSKRAK